MVRRASIAAFLTGLFVLVLVAPVPTASPIRLARHPDYHAGRSPSATSATSGSRTKTAPAAQRLTVNTAREVYPRFSPDGRSIAFSSNRYGNNDVFVVAATGGTPRQLTFHTGNDDVVGWSRDSQHVLFRAAHGDGAFPTSRRSIRSPRRAARRSRCRWTGATRAASRPTASRSSSIGIRRRGRAGITAAATPPTSGLPTSADKTTRSCWPTSSYNRYWPMWGADDSIYFVGDPLPNEKSVKPGSPDVYKSTNNIYKVPAKGGPPVQVTKHTDGSLFWPSMSSDGKVIVYEEASASGSWTSPPAGPPRSSSTSATDEKENEFEVVTRARTKSMASTSRLRASGRSFRRAGRSSRSRRARRHHARLRPTTWRRATSRRSGRPTASRSRSSPTGPVATKSGSAIRKARTPKKISDLDNEKGAIVWTPDSKSLLYTAADKKLYSYCVADGEDGRRHVGRRRPHRLVRGLARQQVGRVHEAGSDAALARLHRADHGRRRAPHFGRLAALLRNERRLDRRRPLPGVHIGRRLQQRHRDAGRHRDDDGVVGAVAARSGTRSAEPRHRQRSAGARRRSGGAADAARRRRRGRAAARGAHRLERHGAARPAAYRAGRRRRRAAPAPEAHDCVDGRRRRRRRTGAAPAARSSPASTS